MFTGLVARERVLTGVRWRGSLKINDNVRWNKPLEGLLTLVLRRHIGLGWHLLLKMTKKKGCLGGVIVSHKN